jgi:Septum formation
MTGRRWMLAVALVLVGAGLTACSETAANDFEAGECTNDDLTGSIGEIGTVDCDEPHTAEAFAQFDVDGDDFPGNEAIAEQAFEECWGDLFEDYVGIPYQESIYDSPTHILPSEESWDAGDRTVICIISATTDGSDLEGSAEGTEV